MIWKTLRSVSLLAILFVLLAASLFWLDRMFFVVNLPSLARQLIIVPTLFFAYTFAEITIVQALLQRYSDKMVVANLALSIVRLLLSFLLILIYRKWQAEMTMVTVFNVSVYYFTMLGFSLWMRKKQLKDWKA